MILVNLYYCKIILSTEEAEEELDEGSGGVRSLELSKIRKSDWCFRVSAKPRLQPLEDLREPGGLHTLVPRQRGGVASTLFEGTINTAGQHSDDSRSFPGIVVVVVDRML
jgi:hypothetical protein